MIDVRIWCDQKFRALNPLHPSGQALFLYLLTNPNTTSIPGLYRAGAAAMAEELEWPLDTFHQALANILQQGLVKTDLKARVIFIPNAIKYNKPQSPNVVKSWALHWDEIPECSLKTEAYRVFKAYLENIGEAFVKAFEETLHPPLLKTIVNQEQEKEQEKEQERAMTTNIRIPLSRGDCHVVSPQDIQQLQQTYPSVLIVQALQQLVAWNEAHPLQRKSRKNVCRHIHTWLSKEEYRKNRPAHQGSYPTTWEHNVAVAKTWLEHDNLTNNHVPSSQRTASSSPEVIRGKVKENT